MYCVRRMRTNMLRFFCFLIFFITNKCTINIIYAFVGYNKEWQKMHGTCIKIFCLDIMWSEAIFAYKYVSTLNLLTPNDPYMGRTAPLTSKHFILYIYSTNTGTESFKHALYSPFFPLQNAVCFVMLTCLVPISFTFYIQGVVKLKKIIPTPKG